MHPGELQPPTAFFPLTRWLARIPDLLLSTRAAMVLTANVLALWPHGRARPGRRSLPIEAPLLTAAILAVPLCSRLLSSMSRFVLSAWPGFVILADALAGARPRARWLVYGLLAVASAVLVRYWADGAFIG